MQQRRDRAVQVARNISQELSSKSPREVARAIAEVASAEELRDLTQELTLALVETLELTDAAGLEAVLKALTEADHEVDLPEDLLQVMSATHYHLLREAVSHKRFERVEGSPWPTAILDRGKTRGQAQLRPAVLDTETLLSPEETEACIQMMWRQREELSDLDADVLDALSALWLAVATSPNDDGVTSMDDLLSMRGLQPKLGGQSRRGGFERNQRMEMLGAVSRIQSLWVTMAEMEVVEPAAKRRKPKVSKQTLQSRAFVITDRLGQLRLDGSMDIQRFIFRPGKVFAHFLFGPGRQTAILSARALQYDPYRQTWEKRLTRFLSWQWKYDGCHGRTWTVGDLLEAVGHDIEDGKPNRTRERLERALERLQADGVISSWQYGAGWSETDVGRKGWADRWARAAMSIEPPPALQKQYVVASGRPPAPAIPADAKSEPARFDPAQLAAHRKKLGLSQAQAARQLGITQAYLSCLERNKVIPSLDLAHRLEVWLQGDAPNVR